MRSGAWPRGRLTLAFASVWSLVLESLVAQQFDPMGMGRTHEQLGEALAHAFRVFAPTEPSVVQEEPQQVRSRSRYAPPRRLRRKKYLRNRLFRFSITELARTVPAATCATASRTPR